MNSNLPLNKKNRGFTLIELAVVMAVMGLLIAGLFQLTTESARTIQDQATAQQIQQLVRASKSYLTGRMQIAAGTPAGVNIGVAGEPGGIVAVTVGQTVDITARVNNFRQGLPATSPGGSTYSVRMLRLADTTTVSGNETMFAVAVFANGGVTLPRPQLGNIASLVGAEGSAVYDGAAMGDADVGATACNESGVNIRASYASLCVNASIFETAPAGALGVATERPGALMYGSPSDFSSTSSQWLSRVNVAGAPQLTRMSTDLTMDAAGGGGQNDIIMTDATNNFIMAGGALSDSLGSLSVNDTLRLTPGNSFLLNGGSISDGVGNVRINDGLELTPTIGNIVMSDATIGGPGGVGGLNTIRFANSLTISSGAIIEGPAIVFSSHVGINGTLRAASFVYTSDERLKKNIVTIDNALDKVSGIRGVTFNYKKDGKPSVGIIAQDVEKVFPELVSADLDGYKAVNYMGLVGPLLEAVHELSAENKKLQKRIEALEKKKGGSQ